MGKKRDRKPLPTDESLCDLKKHLKDRLQDYKRLVRDPTHVCRKCGRAARHAESLCKPEAL